MRFDFSICSLGALMLSVPTLAVPHHAAPRAPVEFSSTLSPIKTRDFEQATGVYRRSEDEFSDLNPQTQSQLIYGRRGTQVQSIIANMTLYAADGLPIVTLERFENLTTSVDCNDDDGIMSLTFISESAFNYAMKSWAFINESAEKKFLVIANHAQCGPDDERQPYIITKIRENKSRLTTFMTARPAQWSEVAHTYDLEFGKSLVAKEIHHRRGVIFDCIINGSCQEERNTSFNIAIGKPNNITNIVALDSLNIDCVNCFVTGSFLVTGRITVRKHKLVDLIMSASPRGVAATLLLNTTVRAEMDAFEHTKQLFSTRIPDAGIEIPKIFSLGASLQYDIGITGKLGGGATFQAGLSASLPDSAIVSIDVAAPDQSQATGFDTGSIEKIFHVQALAASIDVVAFSRPQLVFGVELLDIGHADVHVGVQIPSLHTKLRAAFDEDGVCSGDSNSSTTGVELSSDIGIEVDVGADAKFGTHELPSLSKTLFNISKPLFSDCIQIDGPRHSPNISSVTSPLQMTTITVRPTLTPLPKLTSLAIVPLASTVLVEPTKITVAVVTPKSSKAISSAGPFPNATVVTPGPRETIQFTGIGSLLSYSTTGQASCFLATLAPIPCYGNGTSTLPSAGPLITGGHSAI